jgi:hypothetical protein
MFHTDTVMSALTDLVVLILPIPLYVHPVCTFPALTLASAASFWEYRTLTISFRVWGLQAPVKKKIKAICLLGAGGVATGASIVRLFLVFQPHSFADETVSFVRFNLLAYVTLMLVNPIGCIKLTEMSHRVAEIGIGIICACLPAFGILFNRFSSEYASQQNRYNHNTKLDRLRIRRREVRDIEDLDVSNPTRLSYLKVDSARSIIGEQERVIGGAVSINNRSFLVEPTNFPKALRQGKEFSFKADEVERGF